MPINSTDYLQELHEAIEKKNVNKIAKIMKDYDLKLVNNKIIPNDPEKIKQEAEYWDKQQYIRKIQLNSLYGALLNPACKMYDDRLGQSVTLSGRRIVRHMCANINEILTGNYDYKGEAIVYSDTDSSYFSAWPLRDRLEFEGFDWSKENVISLYDNIAEAMNETWPSKLQEEFNIPANRCVIKASRELVASKGLFITKKRYAVLIFDKEGTREDINGKPGKIKAMGLDLKRSDTPERIQDFLESILTNVLQGYSEDSIISQIKEFREEFAKWPAWEKGTPKRANNITSYRERDENKRNTALNIDLHQKLAVAKNASEIKKIQEEIAKVKKLTLPGHVAASLNWNKLRQLNGDAMSMPIQDGQKVIVCKLKPNIWKMNSVAYPVDEMNLPEWFKQLPFDTDGMEETVLDGKLENLLNVLNWDLNASKRTEIDDLFAF